MELTLRLEKIASYVDKNMAVADIGTDHGYIPIHLIISKISTRVIAADINKDPLNKAKANGKAYHVDEFIEYRLSNGLEKINANEVDCIIIAGMGGKLIEKLLIKDKSKLKTFKKIILSPHRDIESVRELLRKYKMMITNESMIYEDGHYYNIIVVNPQLKFTENHSKFLQITDNSKKLIKIYNKYGKILIEDKNLILKEYIIKDVAKNELLLDKLTDKKLVLRYNEIEEEILLGKKVLNWIISK